VLIFLILVIATGFLIIKGGSNRGQSIKEADEKLVEPDGWPQIQALLEINALPSVKITLSDESPKLPSQSRFGGKPYWPVNKPYPVDKNGNALGFVAQINFAELPEKLENYPGDGLLQFFIANDDLYGLEFLDEQNTLEKYLKKKKNFSVIYHSEISTSVDAFSNDIEHALQNDMSPYSGESGITFSLSSDMASPVDYRFDKLIKSLGELNDETEEYAYETLMKSPDHKIGGYASFTQEDPRGYFAPDDNWLLLLQIDTDSNENIDIMWGDAGIANFFILPGDLKSLNFNNVWYNWDCH